MFATYPSERLIKYTVNTGNSFQALHRIYWFKHCQMGVTTIVQLWGGGLNCNRNSDILQRLYLILKLNFSFN